MKDVKNIILKNRINAKIFSLSEEVYIVGGYLRDVLLGKKSKDIDYIVRGDIKDFACRLLVNEKGKAKEQKLLDGAAIVELKKEQMIRIVLKNGMTLDFTELKGSIEDNLAERDFTINAMAWSPQTGLIDPCNGIRDIKGKKIRAISMENFKNDPLRLLRVYRFVSELGWKVDAETYRMVKELNRLIRKPASERITLEFFKLLGAKDYKNALKMALRDGLLECFLSVSHEKLKKNIEALSRLETALKKIPSGYKINLEKAFSQELTFRGLLRLELVLAGSMPATNRLSLSRLILDRFKIVNNLISESKKYNLLDKRNIFDTFVKAKDALFDFLVLSGNLRYLNQMERFKRIWKKGFVSSEEIMKLTGLKEGVNLGRLICILKKMQFEGRLKTKRDAVKWLKQNYS